MTRGPAAADDVQTLQHSIRLGYLAKLLQAKGEAAAAELRRRIRRGQGIAIRGHDFPPALLEEALRRWGADRRRSPASSTESASPSEERRAAPKRSAAEVDAASLPTPSACRHRLSVEGPSGKSDRRNPVDAAGLPTPSACRRRLSAEGPSGKSPRGAPEGRPAAEKRRQDAAQAEPSTSASSPSSSSGMCEPESSPQEPSPSHGWGVRELKAWLAARGVDVSGCVEKADLEALRASCLAGSCPGAARPPSIESRTRADPSPTLGAGGRLASDAVWAEVDRILHLSPEAFRSPAAYGAAVLGVDGADSASVQRAYRGLMKRLHPDKVGDAPRAMRAFECIRLARDACEKSLLRLSAPPPPRMCRVETLCSEAGRRRFRVSWAPPQEQPSAPVRRYVVAAVDPAFGQALPVTTLEPDYSQELHRFVSVEELTSFVLAEEDLDKMPSLWLQQTATVQVAAANEAGQSAWIVLRFSLVGQGVGQKAAVAPRRRESGVGGAGLEDFVGLSKGAAAFEMELKRRHGRELRSWLSRQLKGSLAAWLKSMHLPCKGSKEELIEQVLAGLGESSATF